MQEIKLTKNPLVSVIIPFLNSALYLNETIESVIHQEYTNWEIILIDDGSIDECVSIAGSWCERFKNQIFLYNHTGKINKGAAASRNLGATKARGELLAFLDSDDVWLPNKLKEQIKHLHENPDVRVVCEATKYWYSWANQELQDRIIYIGAPADKIYNPPNLATHLYPLGNGDSFCTCALIMYTKSYIAIEGFDESFTGINQLFEDQVLFLKICLKEKVLLTSDCNNLYRQRPNSLMHGLISDGNYHKAKLFFLQWLKSYIESNGIKNQELQKLLKKAFLQYDFPLFHQMFIYSSILKRKIKNQLKLLIHAR